MILVHPNSYAAKEAIKALGGRWNPKEKGWEMPSSESFDQAFEACENAARERPMARFFDNDDNYDWLTAPVALAPATEPLPGQNPADVKTGIVFKGHGRNRDLRAEEWVVLCTYGTQGLPAMADEGDFLCGCLNSRKWIYLNRSEIAGHEWTDEVMPVEKAKELYDRFLVAA